MEGLEKFTAEVLKVVKKYVLDAFGAAGARMDSIERRLEQIPAGRPGDKGKDGDPPDPLQIERMVIAAVAKIPPAADGKSVTVSDVLPVIVEQVTLAVSQVPKPLDGKSVSIDDVRSAIVDEVGKAVAAIPPARDGKDADPEAVARMIAALVKSAVDSMPPARDGTSVGVDDVAPMIVEVVSKAVSAIPPAKDGKSVTVEELTPVIADLVSRAVDAIPRPKDGAAADPALIFEMVATAVEKSIATLPVPKDGVSVTPEELAPLIVLEVERAVAAIPKPKDGADAVDPDYDRIFAETHRHLTNLVEALPKAKDGASITVEDVAPLIVAEITKAVAAIPKPKDAVDPDYAAIEATIAERVDAAVAALPPPTVDIDAIKLVAADVLPVMVEHAQELLAERIDGLIAAIPKAKDADVESILATLRADIRREFEALPRPKDGVDATPIHPDTLALLVEQAVAPAVQRALAQIPAAKDGNPGRDALVVDTLPAIDPAKAYPRGTYADHAGGTIRSIRQTLPLAEEVNLERAGWVVNTNGIAGETEEVLDDGRTVVRETTYTDGRVYRREHSFPVVLDRGVWREGEYRRGDHVSCEGSGWIAQVDTAERPGKSAAWRLSTKRGRDGKNFDDVGAAKGPAVVRI